MLKRPRPIARIIPRADTTLGDIRIDNYFWIRDDARKNPDVIAYFDAENQRHLNQWLVASR